MLLLDDTDETIEDDDSDEVDDTDLDDTSDGEKETSAKTISEEDYQKAISDRNAADGRRKVTESKLSKLQASLDATLQEIEELEAGKIDPNNADAVAAAKLRKELRILRAKVTNLEADLEAANAEKEEGKKARELIEAGKIAKDYSNIDPEDLIGKTKEEQLAFCKKYGILKNKEKKSDDKPDSATTLKDGKDKSKLTPAEKFELGRKMDAKQGRQRIGKKDLVRR